MAKSKAATCRSPDCQEAHFANVVPLLRRSAPAVGMVATILGKRRPPTALMHKLALKSVPLLLPQSSIKLLHATTQWLPREYRV